MTLKLLFKQLLLTCLFLLVLPVAQAEILLNSGMVRALPEGVPNTAAYLTLRNTGVAAALTGVNTDVAREAQLHTLIEKQGMMSMRQVKAFSLPANGTLELTPGGDHIMLLGLKQTLHPGQQVTLTLHFDNGQSLLVTLPVQKSAGGHHHHH
ncbi:hypothetical protein NFHSH190041_32550 [Shewanella sp. NFH-SH190041]|nr:hypothetical protein NFHSH190041_32550 [Shewanella sp. NFH-SH190041]